MDYFNFARDNARREFAPQPVENVKISLCKCHVVTGGHLAVNDSCPLHGDPAYVEYLKGEIDPRD